MVAIHVLMEHAFLLPNAEEPLSPEVAIHVLMEHVKARVGWHYWLC